MRTIRVTKNNILKGEVKSCDGCPVAVAMKRVTGKTILIDSFRAHVHEWPFDESWTLPDEVTAWIQDFDLGHPVKPFSFSIK